MIETRKVDATTILDLHGPLASGPGDADLRQAVRLAFDSGARVVILNMEHVPAIDSSGVAALASGHMTAVNRGGHLKLCNLTQKLRDIFAIMRLDAVFDSYETEAAAIASGTVQASQAGPKVGP
jgi:anti-sigma B factor antagonist